MSADIIHGRLARVEQQLDHITQALSAQRSEELVAACSALQATMLELSTLQLALDAEFRSDRDLQLRFTRVAAALASRRESLIRHAAMAEHALRALVPACQTTTYARAVGPGAQLTYGSAGRQSGEFQTVLA